MALSAPSFAFQGGLDLESASLAIPPTRLIAALNHEPIAKGYARVDGHERYDGQPAPSAAVYWLLPFDTGTGVIAQGDTVTGGTSGATGKVLLSPVDFTGAWGDGDAAGTLVLGNVSGTFEDDEQLQVSASPRALANGTATASSASTSALDKTYLEAAQYDRRSSIAKPPGEGPVRGVAEIRGNIYAWRNNVGSTKCKMFKATSSGWSEITFCKRMDFTGGVLEIVEGQTIVGATSGAEATVERVIRTSGDWGTTAAGYLIVTVTSGTFTTEDIEDDSANLHASITGASAVTLPAGGKYHTIRHNFYGDAGRYRLYGANGVGPGFEFDPDSNALVPISTGTTVDTPTRVFEISQHLGLGFEDGGISLSSIAEPVLFDAVQGASSFNLGSPLTDVLQATETAVAIFGQQRIAILTGRDSDSFVLEELTEEAGAEAWTAQRVGTSIYLDRRGLRDLRATQAFGNFKTGTLSQLIESYFKTKQKKGATPVLSLVSRSKSQYRLYYSDASGMTCYMGGKYPEFLPFELNGMQPYCGMTCEMDDGTEGIFIGAEDGYVYRMDSGTNFDGARIIGFVMTPFNHFGSSMQEDRFFKLTVEMEGANENQIGVIGQFDYGDGQRPIAGEQNFETVGSGAGNDFLVQGGGGDWDIASWNEFYWSSPIRGLAEAYVDGIGRNASFIIVCNSQLTEPAYVLQAYTVHKSPRRMKK